MVRPTDVNLSSFFFSIQSANIGLLFIIYSFRFSFIVLVGYSCAIITLYTRIPTTYNIYENTALGLYIEINKVSVV